LDKKPFHNPFAVLGQGRAPVTPAAPAEAAAPEAKPERGHIARAVVRMERSGRGGKEVTVIQHLAVSDVERERLLKALKADLGCGGYVEGDTLVLQGDQRSRVGPRLTARGVRKVTFG